jgi:hypothetical protein
MKIVYKSAAFSVVFVGCVNIYCEQIPHNIGHDMPFSAFRFFPPSNPRSSEA